MKYSYNFNNAKRAITTDGNNNSGDCKRMVHGCTNVYASNYESTATHNDGSCVIPFHKLKQMWINGSCTPVHLVFPDTMMTGVRQYCRNTNFSR